ncbi:hypothetical protein JW823_08715 [bacterium]|nr:hypothetical protein [candidate division CSSED10-310 bacterium]
MTDTIRILQRKLEKEKVFRDIHYTLDVKTIPDESTTIQEMMDTLAATDWTSMSQDVDLLLTGAVIYVARDRSGYDSEWQLNQYGYRVPKKVYKDRLSFELELGLLLVEPGSGTVIIREVYEDKGLAEGAADEIAVFYELIEKQLKKFLDNLQGKEIRSKQYLLYR